MAVPPPFETTKPAADRILIVEDEETRALDMKRSCADGATKSWAWAALKTP
jgi:hypothetical protein